MALETIEILNGVLMIILCSISIYVGIKIASTYFKNKEKNYVFAGLFWIGLVCPWYPGSISFIMVLLFGKGLTPVLYFIIGNIFAPIAITCWIASFTGFLYESKQKLMVFIYIIYAFIFYILFFWALTSNPELIGELRGPNQIDVKYSIYIGIYYFTLLITILITGFLFATASLKLDDREIKMRGKLLLIAFLSFFFGGIIDAFILMDILWLIIQRSLQIISVIMFYLAFIMPEPVKRFLLK